MQTPTSTETIVSTPGNARKVLWQEYKTNALSDDLIAALIVTILLVPQSLAYALLAGMPPVVGVMASLLPILAYAALGSSSTLAVGPVAVLAMMTAQAVMPVSQSTGVDAHLVALVLSLEMAAVFLVAALLRLDVFAALLSAPVLHGFISGASIIIALGQVPQLLGLPIKGNTLTELIASLTHSDKPMRLSFATVGIGLVALAMLWSIRRYGTKLVMGFGIGARTAQLSTRIAPMLVVLLSIAWIAWAPANVTQGVPLAGSVELKKGLSFPWIWDAKVQVWLAMLGPALLLGLVAYVESLAVAEALGARRGEKVQPRRELFGLAAANAAASVSGGMPVTGGFARSIVNFDAGARTRMAGVWTAIFLAAAVLTLGDVLRFLPKAVLAATIIIAVLSLLDLKHFKQAWLYSRIEFGLMLLVALLTIVVGVEEALFIGVLASAGLLLQRTARPHWAEIGRIPGTEVYRNVKRFQVETLPHVLSIRIDESLLFTNSRWLSDTISIVPQQREGLKHVVLVMSGVNDIDLSGLEALIHLARDLQSQDVLLHFSELKGPVSDRLKEGGLHDWLTGQVFQTQSEAHQFLSQINSDKELKPQATNE